MLRLLRQDGSLEEVESATTADLIGDQLICRDANGVEVVRFHKLEVTVVNISDEVATAFLEERSTAT